MPQFLLYGHLRRVCLNERLTRVANLAVLAFVLGVSLSACSARTAEEHLTSAQQYIAAGDGDAAIIELKNALKIEPGLLVAREELAQLLLASGDYPAAKAGFKRALAGEEARADSALWRSYALMKIRTGEAAEVLSTLGEANELVAADQALLGLARLALDDAQLARSDFIKAGTDRSDADDLSRGLSNYGLARLTWQAGELEAAEEAFSLAAEYRPRDPEVLLTKAEFEIEQGAYESAQATYQQVVKLPGTDVPARLGLARVQVFKEQLDAAAAELDSVLKVAPDYVPALYLRALVYYEQRELDDALGLLREILSIQPRYGPALYLLGAVQFQRKDFVQARSNLSAYLGANPGNVSARKLLGAVHMQTGDYESVVSTLGGLADKAVDADDAQALAMLGTAYARLNRLTEASELLERAVELAPDISELRNQLAVTLLAAGESGEAIGQLQSAINVDGELQLSDYLLVLAQLREGRTAEALETATAVRDRAPAEPVGDNLIGAVRLAEGDKEAARTAFNQALAKDPSFSPAVFNLVRIELDEGNKADAMSRLQALLELDANNERVLLELAQLELNSMGRDQDREAGLARAKELLQRAVKAGEDSLAPKLALSRFALMSGDMALADEQSSAALALAPDSAAALLLRSQILINRNDSEAAKPLLQKLATASVSMPAQQRMMLARLQEAAGRLQEAGASYTAVVDSEAASRAAGNIGAEANLALARLALAAGQPGNARQRLDAADTRTRATTTFRLLQADLLRSEGDEPAAREAYEGLVASGYREALFRLVGLDNARGDSAAADSRLNAWLAEHPNDIGAQVANATNQLSTGKLAAAQSGFESVLKLQPNNVVALNNLAWLYQQTGDPRALQTGKQAWELAPDNVLTDTGRQQQALQLLRRVGRERLAQAPDADAALELLRLLGAVNDVEGETKSKSELAE